MNILNLERWTILTTDENDNDYQFTVQYVDEDGDPCSACYSNNSVKFGVLPQLVMDLPIHAKRVGLNIQRQRYRCKNCGATFMQWLPDVDDKRAMTKRLVKYIEQESVKRTFTSIAEDVGVTEKTVRNIFKDHVARLEKETIFITPEWMGIDELHLLHKPRCIITNIKERTVVDLLADRNKVTVQNYLARVPDRHKVQVVTMDMWKPYKDAVREMMPQADIVVDKFHIVRMANEAIESVRKSLRAGLPDRQRRTLMHDRFILLRRRSELEPRHQLVLQTWVAAFPQIGAAYELKEDFMDIWLATSPAEAERLYDAWLKRVPADMHFAFDPIITAVRNWRQEIFAYFNYTGATNAYTEALNGLVKMTNRVGRGYSFDAIRAKLLYGNGLHKVQKPAYKKRWEDLQRMGLPVDDEPVRVFGSDISTLTKQLRLELPDDETTPKSE